MAGLIDVLIHAGIGMVIVAVFMYLICHEKKDNRHE